MSWSSFTAGWTWRVLLLFQPDEAVGCVNSCQSVTKKRHQSQKLFSRWIAVQHAGSTSLAGLSIIVMSENHNFQEKHVRPDPDPDPASLGQPSPKNWPGWYTVPRRTKDSRKPKKNIFRTSVSKNMHLWSESHHTVAFTLYQRILCQPTFLSTFVYIIYYCHCQKSKLLLVLMKDEEKHIFKIWPNIYLSKKYQIWPDIYL